MLKLNYAVVLGSVILVTTRFTYSIASGPSGYTASPSYGGYNQQVQQQQQQQQEEQQNYPQQQQQDQWYSEASYQKEGTTPQEDPAAVTATAGEEDVVPPLPEGWTEHLDPNSGQFYYFNAADGTTSWDRPSLPEDIEQGSVVEGENKEEDPRLSSISAENSPKYDQFIGNNGNTNFNENSTPEKQQQQPAHDDSTGGSNNAITETGPGEMIGSPSEAERWQPNQSPDLKQPQAEESNGYPKQQQEKNLESHRQTDYPMTTSGWGSSPSIQSDSTASLVDEGERQPEQIKQHYQGQPAHINQQEQQAQPGGWGLPRKDEDSSSQSEPWGVTKSTEQSSPQEQSHLPKQQQQQSPPQPIRETPPPVNNTSPDQSSSEGKWGIPKAAAITQPPPGNEQRQSWQQQPPQQHNTQGSNQPPGSDQRPPPRPMHQGPPQQNRLPPHQQHQPTQPPYLQRQQQPPPGQYNPNVSPGPGQYNQQYGGPNNYGRGYPPQQPPPSQQTSTGQVVSQGVDQGTTAVKEALSSTWKGLLGFGAKTREVAGTAREQVVTGATSASQTLGAKSSSKSCRYVRSVFIRYYCVPF